MMDLLLDCSLFIPIKANTGNYYQLSGVPASEIKPDELQNKSIDTSNVSAGTTTKPTNQSNQSKAPGAITFVRSRMLYAKAALNAKGGVRFGMRHIRAFLQTCRAAMT